MLPISRNNTANQSNLTVHLPASVPVAADQRPLARLQGDPRQLAGRPQASRAQGYDRSFDAQAFEAAWAREDIARAVAEITDAAEALRWQEPREERMREPVAVAEGRTVGPLSLTRFGGMWASITLVTGGIVLGLVFLLR
jgi:hypothetical protein